MITMEQLFHIYLIPGFIFAFVYHARHAEEYRSSKKRALLYTLLMIVSGFTGVYLGADVYNLFRSFRGQDGVQRLAVYGAIVAFIIAVPFVFAIEKGVRSLLRNRYGKTVREISLHDTLDLLEPGAFVIVMFIKVRCLRVGCCHGIPCSWGVYSWMIKTTVFPVQIVEICMTLSILLIVYHLKRTPFFRRGMAIFLAAGMFGFGRFFLEYLMYYVPEDRTYLGYFTFWQCVSVLVVIVCVAVVLFLYKTHPSEPMPQRELSPFEQKIREKLKAKLPRRQTVSQKRYNKQWQSTKKRYKKKKKLR